MKMYNFDEVSEKMLHHVCEEMGEIARTGLTSGNIDRAYKLVDMLDNLKDAKYREVKTEWLYGEMGQSHGYDRNYENGYDKDYERENSYRRRYSMSDDKYSRYMDSKREYRHSQTADCKRDLMNKLDDYMEQFTKEMQTMLKDADCQEERDTINRYLQKIKNF